MMLKKIIFNLLFKWGKKIFSFEFKKILHKHGVKLNEEYYSSETPLTELFNVVGYFKNDNYKLLDAGCSGGISHYWARIKDLSVVGIDLAKDEIDRLNLEKKSNSEKYIYAQIVNKKKIETKFINKFDLKEKNEIRFDDTGAKRIQDLFDELSIKKNRIATADTRVENLIKNVEKKTLKEICEENNFEKVNFVDIDLDGNSMLGLNSLENLIKTPELFGLKVEVVFPSKLHGDYFLKICEFMHEFNYSLVKVLPRKYGTYELPNQFSYNIPAQSIDGFDHQGDLIYIKTINHDTIKELDKVNFCKFLTTLEMINLQGFAIKLLDLEKNNFFDEKTKRKFKDLLTTTASKNNFGKLMSYEEYSRKVQEDPYSLMKYVQDN